MPLLAALALLLTAVDAPEVDLSGVRPKVERLLRAEMTGRWFPAAIDRALGGFHETFARDWSPLRDDGRSLVYQSRMTWTAAAFAAYAPERRDEFAKYARY